MTDVLVAADELPVWDADYVVIGEHDTEDDHADAVDPVMHVEDPPDGEKWSDEPAEYDAAIYDWSAP